MSRQITQPVNQVRLTNVAVVRMTKNGKRFEVACYRNKALNYRQGTETDLSEVLQTTRVFSSVSKGQFAKSSDLSKAFATTDQDEICRLILLRGDLQVSDLEREARDKSTVMEVAGMVAGRCVDPRTGRGYTPQVIREAMSRAGFRVKEKRGVKQQFLDCVKLIIEKGVLPLERAKMELQAVLPNAECVTKLKEAGVEVTDVTKREGEVAVRMLADPSLFRSVDKIVTGVEGGRLEIVRQVVIEEGDVNLDSEMSRINGLADAAAKVEDKGDDRTTSTDGNNQEEDEDDLDDTALLSQQTHQLTINSSASDDSDTPPAAVAPTRQDRKKSQKKSKKAKRREKDLAVDRDERAKKEEERRRQRPSEETETITSSAVVAEGETNLKSCNTCGGSFTVKGYRAHFRSDWHRYNLKLKLKGVPPVSEEEFKTCDADAFFQDFE